jgi:hypothetical protein
MKTKILSLLLFSCAYLAPAQQADTLLLDATPAAAAVDTLLPEAPPREGWLKRDYPDPRKAGLLSLIIPGGGQLYNKRWWKVPLVYGAMGGMAAVIDYNQSRYRRLRDALELERMQKEHEFTGTAIGNVNTLRTLRDRFDKDTQMAYFGFFLVYALQAMEAFVDAHLKTFDISDDIGFQLKPQVDISPFGQPALGIGLAIPLNRKTPAPKPVLLGR